MSPMLRLDQSDATALRRAVDAAAASPASAGWFAEIDAIYRDLADAVALRRPICRQSGKCCGFDEYGHLLFVTTLELAWFVRALGADPNVADPNGADRGDRIDGCCPFQAGKACSVHEIRPMGCRVFFCDAGTGDWQADLYEQLHGRLRALHQATSVRYFCVEWRSALGAMGLGAGPGDGPSRLPQALFSQAPAGVGPRRIALTVCQRG
jgi:Fe-S-cluster containining protein